jgi:hypothetical protein
MTNQEMSAARAEMKLMEALMELWVLHSDGLSRIDRTMDEFCNIVEFGQDARLTLIRGGRET